MKTLLLTQGQSQSTENLIEAFKKAGHDLTTVYFWDKDKPSAHAQDRKIVTENHSIDPATFDIGITRSWGQLAHAITLNQVCEDAGVTMLDPTDALHNTESKTVTAEKLIKAGIPHPRTVIFEDPAVTSADAFRRAVEELSLPNDYPVVFKSDYSTWGKGVRFIHSAKELEGIRKELNDASKGKANGKFVMQEFIGDPLKPIQHTRVMVSSNGTLKQGLDLTAEEPLTPSNSHRGGQPNFRQLSSSDIVNAEDASAVMGLCFAGVDIMRKETGEVVVLEVNNSPAVHTYDGAGFRASELAVQSLEKRHLDMNV